ncbi:4Fe-4S binding protein [Vibrio sinensis]|uniref:4Fe-4S binding protein n=1 Tax=Vibrio sinensis TaxID=2302434 RepID=A0A3A6QYL0_9VIBR|nr:4Fe-4S binding protein [Vibrio sinensis]RJX75616.1 4Fe-4S binding protein [Vibrio sinensis]
MSILKWIWITVWHSPNFNFRFLLLFLIPFFTLADNDTTEIPSGVAQLFPSATRIGAIDQQFPVIPVYQLNELLGYVFETDPLTDFIGFSGESINLLIGLDTDGVINGVKMLKHHEPIFLHGLGEQAMLQFIEQYPGHSVKERFIIDGKDKISKQATYFDGVTRATVSVLVINDTIIASALKVARAKLEGFVASAPYEIRQDLFRPLSFDELIKNGYLKHWQTSPDFKNNLSDEVIDEIDQLTQDERPFVDLYFGFANIPIVGRNLFSEQEYQRLLENMKPGEHALVLLNRGQYSFISDDFIPQTISSRLSASQDDFPVEIRDIDFYSFSEPTFNLATPEFDDIKIFSVKSQSGFELHRPFDISLSLYYNQSFLTQNQHKFEFIVDLPNALFKKQRQHADTEERQPLWLTIWQGRQTEIIILTLYLCLLTVIFIKQKTLASYANLTHIIRNLSLLFIVFFIGFYSQGQLSVVNIYTLLLSIVKGFQVEVFLLDPIIFILWVFVFISLFLWGRGLFCGWLCPFGALQEFMGLFANKLKIKQIKLSPRIHQLGRKLKYLILFTLVATAFYSLRWAENMAEVEPFKTAITLNFVRYWPFTLYAVALLLISLKIHKFYCRYLCPLGAGLAILGRYPLIKGLIRRKECGNPCHLCRTKKCGIDAIQQDGTIHYGECIQCFECLVTIESPSQCVVNKYGKKRKTSRSIEKRTDELAIKCEVSD